MRAKFSLGQTVITKVSRQGSYEPTTLPAFSKLVIDGVRHIGGVPSYIGGYDGYCFKEDELMTIDEYKGML